MKNLVKQIQNIIFQQELFERGAKIVVGVSGGPDSACLLDILAKLKPKYDLELIIAHVNYGLRGKDSEADEKFVRKLAAEYGLGIFVLKLVLKPHPSRLNRDTFSLTKEKGARNFPSENQLRDIRYEFFEKIRSENNFDLIAVAHNQDDQAETFLMRIIRGAGLSGLAAMRFKNGKVTRPLLAISREEIIRYIKERKLKYRIDKTNKEIIFLRNRIRNKLIPYLEKNFNPNIKETLFKETLSIGEDYALLNNLAEKTYEGNKELELKKFLKLPVALQRQVLLRAIAEKKADIKDIEMAHVEEIRKMIKSTKNKPQFVVLKGLKLIKKRGKIFIVKL